MRSFQMPSHLDPVEHQEWTEPCAAQDELNSLVIESGKDARTKVSEITPSRSLASNSDGKQSLNLCIATAHLRNRIWRNAAMRRKPTDWAHMYPPLTAHQ